MKSYYTIVSAAGFVSTRRFSHIADAARAAEAMNMLSSEGWKPLEVFYF